MASTSRIDRVFVVDENLNPRIARQLRKLGLKGAADSEIIEKIFGGFYVEPVLVTGDDSTPADHAATLARVNATVATVMPWSNDDGHVAEWSGKVHRNEDEWDQEIVHRWGHLMQLQVVGIVRRYSPTGTASGARGAGETCRHRAFCP